MIGIVASGGKNDIIVKIKIKVPGKDEWEKLSIIILMPIVGWNNFQPILHLSKRMVHCYLADENINQFAIGYMVNT